jgi:hypothetical protein
VDMAGTSAGIAGTRTAITESGQDAHEPTLGVAVNQDQYEADTEQNDGDRYREIKSWHCRGRFRPRS